MPVLSANARGALWMMVAMAAFVTNDTLMKGLAGRVPLFEAVFLRGLVATVLIGTVAALRGELVHRVAPGDRGLLALRLIGEVGGTTTFLAALFHMPIANATAILQVIPLAVTLGAALFLGESVGWRRWLAVFVGFIGVLVIVRPGAAGFNTWALSALAAVAFMALRDLVTRRFSAAIPSSFIAFSTAVAITLASGLATAFVGGWVRPAPAALAHLMLAAIFLFTGYLFIVMAMREGEVSVVAPFRYTILLWAMVYGWAVFAERPDGPTLAGAALIVATGLYTFRRERARLAPGTGRGGPAALSAPRPAPAPPPEPPSGERR